MDWKTFIAQIISTVIWPVVIVFFILKFKEPISKIIPLLEEISFKDILKAKFKQGLKETSNTLENNRTQPENKIYSPITEINDTWLEIESNCQELLRKNKYNAPKTYRALGSRIKKYNLIDEKHGLALDKLRQLRNLAVHIGKKNISQDDANEFIRLSTIFINYINEKLEKNP